MHADVAEWSKALVSGTSFFGSAGSNPAVRMFFLFAFVVRGPRRRFFVFGSVFRALRRHPGRPPGHGRSGHTSGTRLSWASSRSQIMTVDWRCKRRVAVEKGNDSSVTLASKLARIGIKMCSSFSRLGRGHGPLKIGDGAVPSAYIRDLIVFKKTSEVFWPSRAKTPGVRIEKWRVGSARVGTVNFSKKNGKRKRTLCGIRTRARRPVP